MATSNTGWWMSIFTNHSKERERDAESTSGALKSTKPKEVMYMVCGDRMSRNACHHFSSTAAGWWRRAAREPEQTRV